MQVCSNYFKFHLSTAHVFISTWEKSYEHICHSLPHVFVITENTLITIIRFSRYYPFLASNSTSMTGSMNLGTIQICRKVNEHYYYLISTTSVILEIDTNYSPIQSMNILPFHIRLERLKLIY